MVSRLFSSTNLSIDDIANSPVACQLGGCFARADRRGAGTGGVGGGGDVCREDVSGGRVSGEHTSNVGLPTPSGRSLSGSQRGEHGRDVPI